MVHVTRLAVVGLLLGTLAGANARAETLCQNLTGANKYLVNSGRSDGTCSGNERTVRTVIAGGERLWGNRSRGDFVAVGGNTYEFVDQNYQFKTFTVRAQATVIFPSGSRIFTTGNFVNNGTITVGPGAGAGERIPNTKSGLREAASRPAHPGDAMWAAMAGEITSYEDAAGGTAPDPVSPGGEILYRPGHFAGGGGAGGLGKGGRGGGSLFISSGSAFENNGVIEANGEDAPNIGGGGGAGGLIIISSYAYTNTAAINARGGAGGNGTVQGTYAVAPGGGGAGGVVHIISPVSVAAQTAPSVSGGLGGFTDNANAANALMAFGGGAGGNFFSAGGSGGSVVNSQITGGGAQSMGGDGSVIATQALSHKLFQAH